MSKAGQKTFRRKDEAGQQICTIVPEKGRVWIMLEDKPPWGGQGKMEACFSPKTTRRIGQAMIDAANVAEEKT